MKIASTLAFLLFFSNLSINSAQAQTVTSQTVNQQAVTTVNVSVTRANITTVIPAGSTVTVIGKFYDSQGEFIFAQGMYQGTVYHFNVNQLVF